MIMNFDWGESYHSQGGRQIKAYANSQSDARTIVKVSGSLRKALIFTFCCSGSKIVLWGAFRSEFLLLESITCMGQVVDYFALITLSTVYDEAIISCFEKMLRYV